MWNGNFLRAGVGRSSIAPVALGRISQILRRWRFWLLQHHAGLLRRAWFGQHRRQRVQRLFELVVIRLAQRSFAGVVQHAVQFFQIHVHAFAFHALSNSRNLAFRGKPSICFTGRVCSNVGARCPRPDVVPITFQLAAR